jgi:hypothetical protein
MLQEPLPQQAQLCIVVEGTEPNHFVRQNKIRLRATGDLPSIGNNNSKFRSILPVQCCDVAVPAPVQHHCRTLRIRRPLLTLPMS